jgi:hypothetical protein
MLSPKENLPPIKPGTNEQLRNYIDAINNSTQLVTASEVLRNEVIRRFRKAIAMLYRNDRILLEYKMHEQTVCGRLAIYLQRKFKDFKSYAVDVEYYMHTKKKEERQGGNKGRIRIDILVHSRGENGSRADILLAVEAKYMANKDTGRSDKRRLEKLTTLYTMNTPTDAVHSALVGVFIRFNEYGCKMTFYTSGNEYIQKEYKVKKRAKIQ